MKSLLPFAIVCKCVLLPTTQISAWLTRPSPFGVPSWSLVFAFFAHVDRKSSSDFYLALTRIISLISSPICKVSRSHFRLHVIPGSAPLADRSPIWSSCNGLALITIAGCMFIMWLHIRLFIILYYSAISRKLSLSSFPYAMRPFKLLLSTLQIFVGSQ